MYSQGVREQIKKFSGAGNQKGWEPLVYVY